MCYFRALISAVTLLAIAINPVAAAIAPYCCTKPATQDGPCCEAVAKAATVKLPACCAKKHATALAVLKAGCCCFKLPPAPPPARENLAKPSFDKPALDFAGWSSVGVVDAASAGCLEGATGWLQVSGPPILALYCIWLK